MWVLLENPLEVQLRLMYSILVQLEFGDVDFYGGRKTGEPRVRE